MFEYSFVVPVYNEAEVVGEFYRELTKVVEKIGGAYEIIFATGGNTDNTLSVLRGIVAKDKRVKVINMSQRFDYQAALTAGLDYSSGKAVITMDGDLQHPPELIPTLVAEWKKGNDIVYTVREDTLGESPFKKIGSKSFYFLLGLLTHINFEKNCADYRLLSRKAVTAFKQFSERKRYIPGIVSSLGFNKVGVKYVGQSRGKGRSKFSFSRMFSLAIDGIFSFSNIPIRIIIFLGLFMSFFSFIYLVYVLSWRFLNPLTSAGWVSILASILLLSSLQILTLGVIGEYVGRIYEESKRRPLYLVDELIGF